MRKCKESFFKNVISILLLPGNKSSDLPLVCRMLLLVKVVVHKAVEVNGGAIVLMLVLLENLVVFLAVGLNVCHLHGKRGRSAVTHTLVSRHFLHLHHGRGRSVHSRADHSCAHHIAALTWSLHDWSGSETRWHTVLVGGSRVLLVRVLLIGNTCTCILKKVR